jgi:hypothetical protein
MMDAARNAIIYRLMGVRRAWQQAFLSDDGTLNDNGKRAMKDLAHFCYANRSCIKMSPKSGTIDPIATAIAEARREVFLRITQAMNLEEKELQRLINQQEE